jgi:hypothetical protein
VRSERKRKRKREEAREREREGRVDGERKPEGDRIASLSLFLGRQI